MYTTFKRIALFASILILLFFVVFVINQTAQVVGLAERVSPGFGSIVLGGLLIVYAVLVLVPVVLFLRLPRSLTPPQSEGEPEFSPYLHALRKRFISNPHLKEQDLSTREGVEKALAILGKRADELVQQAASNVFISTAISQSGRLDAFLVLSIQSRMVWRIARLYYQRPTLRDLVHLYANIAGTAFLSGELDDLDISQQVEPILSSVLGAVALSIPGLKVGTSIVVNSLLTGTANAFLTLRVGMIARRYCGSLVIAERRTLRRTATAEAAKLLGSIVRQGTARLSKIVWEASKGKVGHTFSGVTGHAKEVGRSFLSRVGLGKKDLESVSAEVEVLSDEDVTEGEPRREPT